MSEPLQASATGAEGSMIEGLFRAHPADEALTRALSALGVDLKRLEPRYPSPTWAKVLEATRQHWFPRLDADEGTRQVGYEFSRGFQETLGGKMVLATLPLLNPMTLLMRWPRFVKLGRSDMLFSATKLGEKSVRLDATDPAGISPYFSVGILGFIFERLRVTPRVRVERQPPSSFTLFYEWD
ncbi:MAG: DUF2378 family protein [Myxococcota bacterium]